MIWGRGWDQLLAADKDRVLEHLMMETLDGDYQTFKANDGAYVREHFFGRDPRTAELVKDWTDDEIWALQRGDAARPARGGALAHVKLEEVRG